MRRRVDDAVARAQTVAAARDDEEHILGLSLRQLDQLAGCELVATQTHGDRTGGLREVRVGRDLVPVRDQSGSSPSQ